MDMRVIVMMLMIVVSMVMAVLVLMTMLMVVSAMVMAMLMIMVSVVMAVLVLMTMLMAVHLIPVQVIVASAVLRPVQDHIKAACLDAAFHPAADLNAVSVHAEAFQACQQFFPAGSQIQERSHRHISADAGVTFQIKHVFYLNFSVLIFCFRYTSISSYSLFPSPIFTPWSIPTFQLVLGLTCPK